MKVETALRGEIPVSSSGVFRESGDTSSPSAGAFGGTGVAGIGTAARTGSVPGVGVGIGARSTTAVTFADPDYADLQGLLRFGFGYLSHASFILLRVKQTAAARAWLATVSPTSAESVEPLPATALQVAIGSEGLRALGVPPRIVDAFAEEFRVGISGDPGRSRRLGDVAHNDPAHWLWGAGDHVPHLMLMVYANADMLPTFRQSVLESCAAGFEPIAVLDTAELDEFEPFGFSDGLSQPELDWTRRRPVRDVERSDYTNLACLGEFVLGYPNEYGAYTDRPLIDPRDAAADRIASEAAVNRMASDVADSRNAPEAPGPRGAHEASDVLPRAEDAPDKLDLGRNGSYLVIRQLQQDVAGLWRYLDRQADGDPLERERLAAEMVGRDRYGAPLVEHAGINVFDYEADPQGLRCPLGAHIRRCNPRNADLPRGKPGLWSWLARTLGFDAAALDRDHVASTRFHRLLRRGRNYGPAVSPDHVLAESQTEDSGLFFVCLNANIGRQFEFVQSAWIAGTKFDALAAEGDPLLGHRQPLADGTPTDRYSLPRADGPDQRLEAMPPFVTMRGGAYFFLPGLRALRYLATAEQSEADIALSTRIGTGTDEETNMGTITTEAPIAGSHATDPTATAIATATATATAVTGTATVATTATTDTAPETATIASNTSRPVPRANTGSALLDRISDASLFLIQMQRRIDPFLRPAFDAVLRDPVARLTTALINRHRPDEKLALAEERPLPDEEAMIDSIVDTFRKQMSGLWKPGGFERGGNTKTHGIVRARLVIHEGLPEHLRRGIFATPRSYPAWVRFSGPGPYVTPDIDDVGFMSISVKLMDVPGPKLMGDEQFTQDMFGVSTPTFVTPDTRANAHLQEWSLKNASIFHFVNFRRPHLLDLVMQGLWVKTQSSPFEAPYFSCVPYLLGEGQAMQYSFWPVSSRRTPIPRLPLRPPDDYLRAAMLESLDAGDVELELRVQVQTDPHLMPIENAAVLWPERLSPRVPVATLHIPKQKFDSPAQIGFARRLSFNPWHCIAEHRPLGNQSRARRRMYHELSKFRQQMNRVSHYEPDGSETFD